MITNIDIDETVVAEAMRLSGARTKREVVDRALREMVARASRPSVRELFGIGGVDAAYDPKAPWVTTAAEIGRYRVEEPQPEFIRSMPVNAKASAAPAAKKLKSLAVKRSVKR